MICIINYEAGNLRSVQKAVEFSGARAVITSDPVEIARADKIIFPGVGAFGQAVEKIDQKHLREPLLDYIATGRPFLGICLGMQLLFAGSEEDKTSRGLAVLQGRVKRFAHELKVPHLGWNVLIPTRRSPLWEGIPQDSYFYFAHSYFFVPDDPAIVIGETEYGGRVPIALQSKNIYGLQFHPEKSQKVGLQVLRNFINLKD
ncbi:MAG TPA: imidazole glycerol phosphate synthase subunit HisH [bacterium]|nr:imidazole glycerol phosphate synthase subunit HisH [bacterium]HPN45351.1 imidazole glycerol phosphate synthase subunit HisH [bacterium]